MHDLDSDAFIGLTNWDEDDDDSEMIEDLLNFDDFNGKILDAYEGIADTITINYDEEDIKIEGKTASVKVEYELIDWTYVWYSSSSVDVQNFLDIVDETITVKGKIEFSRDKADWKISKITKIDEVFQFKGMIPPFIFEDIPTEPNTSDPSETSEPAASSVQTYTKDDIKNAYLALLEEYKDEIRVAEEFKVPYGHDCCGLYDFNSDGIPELFFYTGEKFSYQDDYANYIISLYIFTYDTVNQRTFAVVHEDSVYYTAGDGGSLLIYDTPDYFVITTAGGEEGDYRTTSLVYNNDFELIGNFCRKEVITDWNSYTTDTIYYRDDIEITQDDYESMLSVLVKTTVKVLISEFWFGSEDVEFPLKDYECYVMMNYDEVYSTIANGF
jgi:hypothetical protein